MAVEWTENLAVGNATIDSQHKELFKRFNQLLDACQQRKGREKIGDVLTFLDDYVVFHFGEEEKLMARHAYPEGETHKAQHKLFIRQLNELRQTMQSRGPSIDLLVTTNQALVHWIVMHIKDMDVRFGAFLKAQL
jgi:hemerythrin